MNLSVLEFYFFAFRQPSNQVLFPLESFISERSGDWKRSLLLSIPMESRTTSAQFWVNWAAYITSDPELLTEVWLYFINAFLTMLDDDSVLYRAHALVSLAFHVKPWICARSQVIDIDVTPLLSGINKMMESTNQTVYLTALAISYVLFDLESIKRTGNPVREQMYSGETGLYRRLLAIYRGEDPDSCEDNSMNIDNHTIVKEEPVGVGATTSEKDWRYEPRVLNLRKSGLVPRSFIDIYNIITGSTTGPEAADTEC